MPGFFLSLGGARSYPPSGRKTPDTARAFFGLRDPRRKESPSASLLREVARGARRKEFFSLSFLFKSPFSVHSFSRPAGASSLKREPSSAPFLLVGRGTPRGGSRAASNTAACLRRAAACLRRAATNTAAGRQPRGIEHLPPPRFLPSLQDVRTSASLV